MPKNLFQEIIFTIIMVIVMVYAMICYNIALSTGGMSNFVFLAAFKELAVMGPIAFVLDFFLVGKIAKAKAFKMVDVRKVPADEPCCDPAFQGCRRRICRCMAPDNGAEFPDGALLAAFLCRSRCKICFLPYFQGEEKRSR